METSSELEGTPSTPAEVTAAAFHEAIIARVAKLRLEREGTASPSKEQIADRMSQILIETTGMEAAQVHARDALKADTVAALAELLA